jgi:tRNA G46 methylase TrmB
MNMSGENYRAKEEIQRKDTINSQAPGSLFLRKPPASLNPIVRLFESPQRLISPYIKKGQVVADLGCGSGQYTLALIEIVGPAGKVYAIDLDKKRMRSLEKKTEKGGYYNIELHATSASDLSFIKDRSVDFVLANGQL